MPISTMRLVSEAVYGPQCYDPRHISLTRWADQFVVLPATANLLGQVANGLASDLLTTTILAFGAALSYFRA